MIEDLLLGAFAAAAALSAIAMLVARHPMRVAIALIVCMLALAGIYALLGVHVIAVFQVLIYVGAVMVFMVYAIMLLDVREHSVRRFSACLVPGIAGLLVFLAIVAHGIWHDLPEPSAAAAGTRFNLNEFSRAFLSDYWLHFELTSVLLVAAIVAALAVLKVGRRPHG